MKYKMLLMVLLLKIGITVSAQNINPIVFTLIMNNGNHSYSIIVGSDARKVNDKYNSPEMNSGGDRQFSVHKYVVSKKTEQHILSYIKKSCVLTTNHMVGGENVYYIQHDKMKTMCYLPNKDQGKIYFTNLKKWIEDSPYKNACKQFLVDVQAKFINGNPFPLTVEQQQTLDASQKKKK